MKNVDDFLKEYSPYNLRFDKVDYRRGARITGVFGLTEGYTKVGNELVFNTVYIHTGVDRSAIYGAQGQRIENLVVTPFNFNRSSVIQYKPDESYGYLIQLFNDDYGFEMRIAHMDPMNDVVPEIRKALESHCAIPKGTVLGRAGNYGKSGGAHTHTEFLSQGTTCQVFDDLLCKAFPPEEVLSEYSKMSILMEYQTKTLWTGKPAQEIFNHYETLKKGRGISFINKYKYNFAEAGTNVLRTRYSSEKLFNGL